MNLCFQRIDLIEGLAQALDLRIVGRTEQFFQKIPHGLSSIRNLQSRTEITGLYNENDPTDLIVTFSRPLFKFLEVYAIIF